MSWQEEPPQGGEPDYAQEEENVYDDIPDQPDPAPAAVAATDGATGLTAVALYDYQAGALNIQLR